MSLYYTRFSNTASPTLEAGPKFYTPQCAVMGWPGHIGRTSFAALSHRVKMKSGFGASGLANSSRLLLRKPFTGRQACSISLSASGRTDPEGRRFTSDSIAALLPCGNFAACFVHLEKGPKIVSRNLKNAGVEARKLLGCPHEVTHGAAIFGKGNPHGSVRFTAGSRRPLGGRLRR